ncbi:hypothetical protein CP533_6159 [Ophiocordyceps camponoti-saundersi (nom. inval.)]|nr:hypothetical protein CP533_6159 [Ophiocordyceps camponoti-saundersi (nom. inval.)]
MDDPSAILNIHLSSSDDEDLTTKKPDRTLQTEAAFQAIKRQYSVKIENGQIYQSINLPLHPAIVKQSLQEVVHAVEELYFFRRYPEALRFIDTLKSDGSDQALDHDTRHLLTVYHQRCQQRLDASS